MPMSDQFTEQQRFRKKPVVIEVIQYTDPSSVLRIMDAFGSMGVNNTPDGLKIVTLEGTMTAAKGDWIIRDIKGEIYPCKPEIFAATYEPISCSREHGLDEQRLREIREREKAATSGPRTCVPSCVGEDWGFDVPELEEADYRDSRFGNKADAQFIAHARADIPWLLGEHDRLSALLAELEKGVSRSSGPSADMAFWLDGPSNRGIQ